MRHGHISYRGMSQSTYLHGFLVLALLLVVPASAFAAEIPDPPEEQPFLDDRAWNDDLWSPHLQQIMDVRVLPEFARGAFETGLRAGLEELIETAAIGPDGDPPRAVGAWHERLHVSPRVTTPFALGTVLWFVVPGVLCLLLAALLPRNRAALSKIGVGLIVVGALFWVALALLAAWGVYRYMPLPAAPPPGARPGSAGGGFGGGGVGGAGGGGDF